jgi:PBP1b-binding outer membrane lipoprotein LpoB
MRKWIAWVLIALMVFTLVGCKNNNDGEDLPDDTGDGEVTDVHRTDLTPEGLAWRDKVTSSPIIAEIEHKGTIYTVHALDALRYIYNTETTEIITGAPVSNAKATVLKDWISP